MYLHTIDEFAYVLNEWIIIDIYFPISSAVKQFETIIKRRSSPSPIARTFITPAVFWIRVYKIIKGFNCFTYQFETAFFIFFC